MPRHGKRPDRTRPTADGVLRTHRYYAVETVLEEQKSEIQKFHAAFRSNDFTSQAITSMTHPTLRRQPLKNSRMGLARGWVVASGMGPGSGLRWPFATVSSS